MNYDGKYDIVTIESSIVTVTSDKEELSDEEDLPIFYEQLNLQIIGENVWLVP